VTYCKHGKGFPEDCKKKETAAVEEAIKAMEAAPTQPELRSVAPLLPKANSRGMTGGATRKHGLGTLALGVSDRIDRDARNGLLRGGLPPIGEWALGRLQPRGARKPPGCCTARR
jgi:hypothetical protein